MKDPVTKAPFTSRCCSAAGAPTQLGDSQRYFALAFRLVELPAAPYPPETRGYVTAVASRGNRGASLSGAFNGNTSVHRIAPHAAIT